MAIDYYVEFITVPVAVLVLAVLAPPSSNVVLDAWLAGYLSWVLIEYWMHRWAFHVRFRRQHMIHHKRPFDQEGAPSTWHAQGALAATTALLGVLLGPYIGLPTAGGLLLGYGTYIYTHHAIHAHWLGPHSMIRRRHELHHRGIEKNYAMLNPLMDHLFGTYLKPK